MLRLAVVARGPWARAHSMPEMQGWPSPSLEPCFRLLRSACCLLLAARCSLPATLLLAAHHSLRTAIPYQPPPLHGAPRLQTACMHVRMRHEPGEGLGQHPSSNPHPCLMLLPCPACDQGAPPSDALAQVREFTNRTMGDVGSESEDDWEALVERTCAEAEVCVCVCVRSRSVWRALGGQRGEGFFCSPHLSDTACARAHVWCMVSAHVNAHRRRERSDSADLPPKPLLCLCRA